MKKVYTDGGCRNGLGAFAFYIPETKEYRSGYAKNTTNSIMEIASILESLRYTGGDIQIYSDSQYVVRICNGEWKAKKYKDLFKEIKTYNFKIDWIKGHSGIEGNEIADQLCSREMDELITERKEYELSNLDSLSELIAV